MSDHTIEKQIIKQLTSTLNPIMLEVIDESHLHANHFTGTQKGGTHFKIKIASEIFKNLSRTEAHRYINKLLAYELQHHIHALSIEIVNIT